MHTTPFMYIFNWRKFESMIIKRSCSARYRLNKYNVIFMHFHGSASHIMQAINDDKSVHSEDLGFMYMAYSRRHMSLKHNK